MVDSLKLKIH
jgi:hypothetical protein